MRRVHSHVLLVLDAEAKKYLDRIFQRTYTLYERFASLNRLLFRGDFDSETMEWTYTDVKDPTIARTRLLEDLAKTSRQLEQLKEIVDEFREKVKAT